MATSEAKIRQRVAGRRAEAGPRRKAIRVLLVEDVASDAELALRELRRAGLEVDHRVVKSEEDFRSTLAEFRPEVILSDFSMPEFDGMLALRLARELAPDTPFVFVSGTLGEEYAIRALQQGATDYVLKSNLARLPVAVERALQEVGERAAKHEAERARQESEAGLRRAQAMAGLAHVVTRPDGSFESWSETLPRLAGLKPDQMPKSTREWLQLVHPDDRAHLRATAIEAGRRGTRMQVEYRLKRGDGAWLHIRQASEPIEGRTDAEGRTRWFGTLQDMTALTQAAQALRASEQRYRATFEQAAVGIVHTSLEGDVLLVNRAFCELTGYSRVEAIQLHIRDLMHPEDFAQSAAVRARISAGTGEPYQRELRLLRADRSQLWASATTALVRDAADRPLHFVSVVQDMSERKRAEGEVERFRSAMDVTIDSIYLTDPETMRFLYVNETACRRLGYTREALLQKTPYEVVGKSREQVKREYDKVIAAGEQGTRVESEFVRSDGSRGWTELHRRALRTGDRWLLVTIGRDITERKRAEFDLRDSEARFRSLTELSSDWYWEQDAEFRFVSFSGGEDGHKWGDDQSRQIGRRRWELPGVVPLSATWDEHRALLEAHRPFRDFVYVRTMPNGDARYVSASGEPVFDAAGRFTGYRGTARDITERRRGEAELRRFRLALDNSADIIIIVDRATMRHVDVNQTACRLLGYAREELLAMGPTDILPVGREELERTYDDLIANPDKPSGMRSYYRCKDGSRIPFESTRRLLRAGERWIVVAISRDIRDRVAAESALRETEERFRQTFEFAGSGIAHVDLEGRFQRVNPSLCRILGYEAAELIGKTVKEVSHPEDHAVTDAERARMRTGALQSARFEKRHLRKDGSTVWVELTVALVRDADGQPRYEIAVFDDITERKLQQMKIERLSRVHAVLSGINAAIVRTRDRGELYREACRIAVEAGQFRFAWLCTVDEAEQRLVPVASAGADEGFLSTVAPRLSLRDDAPGGHGVGALAVRGRKAVVVNDVETDPAIRYKKEHAERGIRSVAVLPLLASGRVVGALGLHSGEAGFFDDEEMRLLRELAGDVGFALENIAKAEQLNYLALYDSLTGLANRTLLLERLGQQIHAAGQAGAKFVLASLDLERLTTINESLGRQVGDAVLRQVAERLRRHAGPNAAARITADQFVAVLPPVEGRSEAGRVAANLVRACFAETYLVGEHELKLAAKAGLALFPNDGVDAETLLANAEAALRKAKQSGERQLFYTPDLIERTGATLTLENKLRRALEKDEFVLHYQPKFNTESRRIVGLEALIRWQSPELGLVPPGKFIPLMEETGMILDVGAWALRRAALDHRRWTEAGLKPPRVAVNVSAIQLRQREFVQAVEDAILEGVAPTGIDLEITESLIMEDIEANIEKLKAARALGVGVAIDDFGTGYSSLAYLAKLPVQSLKIDRSFIIAMLGDPDTMTLVQTIISLAHAMRLKVVAEGVDAEEQAKVLRLLRCDELQGYLLSKPLPEAEIGALLGPGR